MSYVFTLFFSLLNNEPVASELFLNKSWSMFVEGKYS